MEVESGDEHEHYDGQESEHPSDEQSSSSSNEKKGKKKKEATTKSNDEVYISDPLDLLVESIVADRIAPKKNKSLLDKEDQK